MTTVEERIRQIEEAARSRGLVVSSRGGRPKTITSTNRVVKPQTKLSPRELATRRRLPKSFARMKRIEGERDWERRNRREKLERTEERVAAGLIALALGDGWRREYSEYQNVELVHATGCRMRFRREWHKDRYSISPIDCRQRRDDPLPEAITVDAGRTPASIAGDITNRIINAGLFEKHRESQQATRGRRQHDTDERLSVLRIARAGGHQLIAPERRWKDGRPTTNDIYSADEKTALMANRTYMDRFHLSIETVSEEHAVKIAAFVRGLGS